MSPPGPNYAQSIIAEEERERERNRQASIWHLVDLKRAGYSPRMTERTIKRGSVILIHQPMTHSPTGSQGSLCESGTSCLRAFHGARVGRS